MNLFFKFISVCFLALALLINRSSITRGTSFEDHSWVSLGSVNGGISIGCLAFKNKDNTALEVGMIYALEEDSDLAYGFDLYKFKDFSGWSLFGSIGVYLVRDSKYNQQNQFYYYDSKREIAYSIGIQYDFKKFDIGFGYHSIRGPSIQLQFVKSPRAKMKEKEKLKEEKEKEIREEKEEENQEEEREEEDSGESDSQKGEAESVGNRLRA